MKLFRKRATLNAPLPGARLAELEVAQARRLLPTLGRKLGSKMTKHSPVPCQSIRERRLKPSKHSPLLNQLW